MKIRIFRTRERSTTPVWEVTPTGLRELLDLDGGHTPVNLSEVVDSLDDRTNTSALTGTRIVHYSVAASMENDNAFLYHSFLLRE